MSEAAPSASLPQQSPDDRAAPPEHRTARTWLLPLLLGVAYLAFWQIAPRVHTESTPAVLLSTVISLALLVWFPAQVARSLRTPAVLLSSLLVSGLLVIPLKVTAALGHVPAPWSWLLWLDGRFLPGLGGLLFVWFAASVGALLSLLLRGPNMIPPVAAVLAVVDIWTVLLGGPVQQIMQSETVAAQRTTAAMTVKLPAPQRAKPGAQPIQGVVGFADFLFIAFFVAGIGRFVPSPRTYSRTVQALVLVLCLYMLAGLTWEISLPALAPMAVVMLALHWRHFRYSRSESFALLYAGLLIAVIAAAFWYFGRSARSETSPAGRRRSERAAPVPYRFCSSIPSSPNRYPLDAALLPRSFTARV